jgi:glutaminyl-peptide cyclotransferase
MTRALRLLVLAAALAAPAACAGRLRPEVDGARAQARVVHQVEAGPRVPGTEAHARILAWLQAELTRLGGRVERQVFTDSTLGRPLVLTNVIARFGPEVVRRGGGASAAGTRTGGTHAPRGSGTGTGSGAADIVLCAHWDSRPWADQDPDPAYARRPVPGANDGASGVAVLLEVAELMSRRPPRVAVDLVFFDGEDLGRAGAPDQFCLGSRHYAAGLADGAKPRAAFLFDMVGDRDLRIHPEVQSAERAANLVALVLEGARATGAGAFRPEPLHAITDDHVPLLEAGVPAVDIIDFDYPAWHTHRDLPDQTSAASLAQVARVAAWLVYHSALSRPVR